MQLIDVDGSFMWSDLNCLMWCLGEGIFDYGSLYISFVGIEQAEDKGKVPPRLLLVEPVIQATILIMPLEPRFGTIPLSSTLSQLYTLCGAQLLLTP